MQRILPPRYSSRLGVNRNSGVLRKINLKESNVNTDTLTWRDKEKQRYPSNPPLSLARLLGHKGTVAFSARSSTPQQSSRYPEFQGKHFYSKIEEYQIGSQLGRGAYASVWQATHKTTKQSVAVKSYDKSRLTDPRKRQNLLTEVEIMAQLSHPAIIQFIGGADSQRQVHIIMEHFGHTNLSAFIKAKSSRRVSENIGKKIFRQVVEAVKYCHDNSIAHRDIKMQNILLGANNQIKLIDFGFSTFMSSNQKVKFFCGTPSYMAPEIVRKQEFLAAPADVWALGILLFGLICGSFPFTGISEKDLYRNISKGDFTITSQISAPAKRLIKRMLKINPDQRPNCQEILDDPWLDLGEIKRPLSVYRVQPNKENLHPQVDLSLYRQQLCARLGIKRKAILREKVSNLRNASITSTAPTVSS